MLGKNGSQTKKPFAQKEIHLRGTITRLIIFGVVAIVCFILNKNGVHLYKFVKPQEGEAVKESRPDVSSRLSPFALPGTRLRPC